MNETGECIGFRISFLLVEFFRYIVIHSLCWFGFGGTGLRRKRVTTSRSTVYDAYETD